MHSTSVYGLKLSVQSVSRGMGGKALATDHRVYAFLGIGKLINLIKGKHLLGSEVQQNQMRFLKEIFRAVLSQVS